MKEKLQKEIEGLIVQGNKFVTYLNNRDDRFRKEYQVWYTKSYELIRQLTPNRLGDFSKYYDNDKAKPESYPEKGINRYLSKDMTSEIFVAEKVLQQVGILEAANSRFDSLVFDLKLLIQEDIFDSEIDNAKHLLKKGFYRASGAICGVIIEKHLGLVCENQNIKLTKKSPTISDFNDELKKQDIISLETWKFIQYIGSLRNLCTHNKDREPKKEEIEDLIGGTEKIIKTVC